MSVPDFLTLFRIFLIPLIFYAFLDGSLELSWLAFFVFIVACVTDFLDGYIARVWKQTSRFGQVFDPIADKLLIASVLLILAGFGHLTKFNIIPAIFIVCREILISGIREYIGSKNDHIPVIYLSKIKTGSQMFSLAILLFPGLTVFWKTVGLTLLWGSCLLSCYTGMIYLKNLKKFWTFEGAK
jgi:cardiolipin synthase